MDTVPVPNKASFGMNTLRFCCQSFDAALKYKCKSAFLKLVMPVIVCLG